MKTPLFVSELSSSHFGSYYAIARDADGQEYYVAPADARSISLIYHGATILAIVTPNAVAGRLPIATEVEVLLP